MHYRKIPSELSNRDGAITEKQEGFLSRDGTKLQVPECKICCSKHFEVLIPLANPFVRHVEVPICKFFPHWCAAASLKNETLLRRSVTDVQEREKRLILERTTAAEEERCLFMCE